MNQFFLRFATLHSGQTGSIIWQYYILGVLLTAHFLTTPEIDLINATTDKVAQVTWMKWEQIKELFEHNMFVETLEYFFTEVDKLE